MPDADQFSIALMVAVNLMTVAFALPWFMGQKMSRPARNAQQFLLLQGLAWLLVFGAAQSASFAGNALLAASGSAAAVGALWQRQKSLKGWLGPRGKVLTRVLVTLCLLTVGGVLVLLQNKAYRLAWFNIGYGLAIASLVGVAFLPRTQSGKA